VVLIAVAVADGVRSNDASPTKSAGERLNILYGVLIAGDAHCRAEAVRLPTLAEEHAPVPPDCGGQAWSQDGSLVARCRNGVTSITSSDGQLSLGPIRGCGPAWRADGALAVIRDGSIVLVRRHGPEQLFMTREELDATLSGTVGRPETYSFA
jgi:hypothetical protein